MVTLKNASQKAAAEIEQILHLIEPKFESIDYDNFKIKESFYIKCNLKEPLNEIKDIVIRFIPDFERQNPKLPKDLKEYYNQGGGEKLREKFNNSDENAWKCEVFSNLTNGKRLEYGIGINERNFSIEGVINLLNEYLIKK